MRTATIQGAIAVGEAADLLRGRRIVGRGDGRRDAQALFENARDRLGVVLVHRDHQPGGVGIARAQVHQLGVGLREHRRHPLPRDVERRAQPLAGELARQPIVERRLVFTAVGRRPLHAPVDAREVDGPHDVPILQCVAVAVLEVGLGQLAGVVDEGNRPLIGPERRPRQAEPPPRRFERLPDGVAPGAAVARVVDLVEDRQRRRGPAAAATWVDAATC